MSDKSEELLRCLLMAAPFPPGTLSLYGVSHRDHVQ